MDDTGRRFRGRIAMVPPPGWYVEHALELNDPSSTATVRVSSEQIDPSVSGVMYAAVLGNTRNADFWTVRDQPAVEAQVLGDKPGFEREFNWPPSGPHSARSIQQYYVDAGRAYTVTATIQSDFFAAAEPLLRDVLGSLRLEEEPGWPLSRVSAGLPIGWYAAESTTLTGETANVIASSRSLDSSVSTKSFADEQGRLLRENLNRFAELSSGQAAVLGGRPGYERVFSWSSPDGDPVTQIQQYFADVGRGYTATATTPSGRYAQQEATLREVLESLRIDE